MKILGIDPSLTAYGWAIHDTEVPVGSAGRCASKGRFSTSSKIEFVDRYTSMRDSLKSLIEQEKPDFVGIEHPVFSALYSEGMYGLFLYSCEALKTSQCNVVFWSPLQVKAHARESLGRPPKWMMDKVDMVEAAKHDAGPGRWNHNEADAYLVARLSGQFWKLHEGQITTDDLTPVELKYFTEIHKFTRGKRAGREVRKGTIYREDDRFFMWSQHAAP